MSEIVTRFAPSPTGHLHVGGARTALFNWAYARGRSGVFLLRVEDTDQARSSEASTRGILEDMAWLGLDWDEGPAFEMEGRTFGGDPRGVGPFYQSQRLEQYNAAIERLIETDRAYHAFESPEALEEKRKAALAAKKPYRYDRAGLEIPKEERVKRARDGEAHVVRFRCPDEKVTVVDEVLGEVTVAPEEVDDFILRKRDGFPTYHMAVVVDDQAMGVTHVVRGQEHLYNTPRHVSLQKALEYRVPAYAHLPLIFNPDGSKMSKRDKDKAAREACQQMGETAPPAPEIGADEFSAWLKDKKRQLQGDQLAALADALRLELPEIDVSDFRASGYLPETVCNYLALLGWSPPGEAGKDIEKFDNAFLAKWFDLPRIGKTNSRFDRRKLLAFNGDAITEMSDGAFRERWRRWCARYEPTIVERLEEGTFNLLAEAVRPRSKTLKEATESAWFAVIPDDQVAFDEKAVSKTLHKNEGEGLGVLRDVRERLASLEAFTTEAVQSMLESFASEREIGLGKVAQPLRVALTGSTVSPPIDATVAALGKESALKRIDRCLSECAAPA